MTNSNIKVGDTVTITNSGKTYTDYAEMFIKMGFKDDERNRSFNEGAKGKVFVIETHPETGCTLLGVENRKGKQCLINVEGVEKVLTDVDTDVYFDIISDFCKEQGLRITEKDIFKYLLKKVQQ